MAILRSTCVDVRPPYLFSGCNYDFNVEVRVIYKSGTVCFFTSIPHSNSAWPSSPLKDRLGELSPSGDPAPELGHS